MSKTSIFEQIDYNAIFQGIKSEFLKRAPEFSALLESDPAVKLLEIAAYQEMLMRFRIHEAIKSNLLAHAVGQDLDNLAEFYNVQRAESEEDEAFRNKIKARIQAWSPAGSRDHYKFHTLQADPRVKDARADSPAPGLVRIAVLSTENNGFASNELLEKVTEIITSDSVRVLTDTVEIVGCTIVPIALSATVTLHPETPQGVLATAKTKLEAAFEAKKSLGWDVSKAWLIANLFVEGIQNIALTSPANDVAIADDACAALTSVTLTFGGRQW
jgi:phage-related baseplate assembly protein